MLEEEKKEVELEAEEAAEENQEEQKVTGKEGDTKTALIAFILACVSFIFVWVPVVGLVCAIVSLVFFKKLNGVLPEQKPFDIFAKITKIASLILVIVGIVVTAAGLIGALVGIIVAIVGAIANAASSIVLL